MREKNTAPRMNEELKQKAMEHDMTDLPGVDPGAVCQKIEAAVVGGCKAIENGVVEGFTKMTDKIVEKFLTREGETVKEAKQRMNGENHR